MDTKQVFGSNLTKASRTDETADKLISLILSRNMKEGDKLPNEAELSSMLNVGRSTFQLIHWV